VGLGAAWLLAGCAPALSSFTPAHVPPKKHLQGEGGFDISVPSNITSLIDDGRIIAKSANDKELTEEDQRRLFRDGAAFALNPPSLVWHTGIGYVPLEHFEVNGRLSAGAWRLGSRYQFLDQTQHGVDGTLALGGGHYTYEFPLSSDIPLLKVEDFSRWQLDASFLIGKHGTWYRFWGGPRIMLSFYGTEMKFEQPAIPSLNVDEHNVVASLDGSATYLGGQTGVAFGYKWVFIGFELTVAKFWTSASLELQDRKTDLDIDSVIVYPGLALMFEL
jgi:hypothetical protein